MSTYYYALAKPVTQLRVEQEASHVRLTIWINHENAGTLLLREPEVLRMVCLFAAEDPVLHIHWGRVVSERISGLEDDMQLISAEGHLITVGEIRNTPAKAPLPC